MEQNNHSNEHKSAFDVVGPQNAFPIVLVHGVSWTRKMWIPQLEALSDEFRVIAIDLSGHGVLHEQLFQLKAAVQAVMESLRQQTDDRTLIVGLSLGGCVAMACAHDHIPRRLLDWCYLAAVLIIAALLVFFPDSIVPLLRLSFQKADSAACKKKLFGACFQKI